MNAEASSGTQPYAIPLRLPQVRIRMDVGTWTYGQPLASGSGEIHLDMSVSDTIVLHQMLGPDGYEAFLHVIRHATPMPTEDGGFRLELAGYSGRWLRETCGFSERAANRAVRALKDSGLVITASMPGARGAEGKQRGIVTSIVGLSNDVSDVVETRRGRGSRSSRRPTLLTHPQNRQNDASTVSTQPSEPNPFAQVSAVVSEPSNGTPSSREVGTSTSLDPSGPHLASLAGTDEASGREVVALCSAAASWEDLRDTLARRHAAGQVDLFAVLRPIVSQKASAAGAMVTPLRLGSREPDRPVADLVTKFLVQVLTDHGGRTSAVWAHLRQAGVHVPDETVDVLGPRLVAAVAAGLENKRVANWCAWIARGLTRHAVDGWNPTPTMRLLAQAIEAAYLSPVTEQPAPPERSGDIPTLGESLGDLRPEPQPTGGAYNGRDDDGAGGTREDQTPATPVSRSPRSGRIASATPPPATSLPAEVEQHLVAAVAWGGPEHPMARHGVDHLRTHPRLARALVAIYLEDVEAMGQ